MSEFGLNELAQDWGYEDPNDLLEEYVFESVIPGICRKCGYTTDVEPDQGRGWCEACGENTVVSAFLLGGMI